MLKLVPVSYGNNINCPRDPTKAIFSGRKYLKHIYKNKADLILFFTAFVEPLDSNSFIYDLRYTFYFMRIDISNDNKISSLKLEISIYLHVFHFICINRYSFIAYRSFFKYCRS